MLLHKLFSVRGVFLAVCVLLCLTPASAPAAATGHGHGKPVKKAIVLVTFGTSIPEAQGVFEGVEERVRKLFPGVEVRWAYTAKFIRDKVKKEQGLNWLSPEEALAKLMADGYTHVAVQSLHVIGGREWHDLATVVHGFQSMRTGFRRVAVGYPLCGTTDDLLAVAEALLADLPEDRKPGQAVVFMGHGTHHPGGVAYPALAYILQKNDPLAFMGAVEGYPELGEVKAALVEQGVRKAYLLPFMTVAGDHAQNDMAGEGEDSWKSVLTAAGIECEPVMESILENPAIVNVYMDHLKALMSRFE
jgi:sirohydrochlorin cobaltochelatase